QARAVHGDGRSSAALHVLQVHELDDAVVARLDGRAFADARGGAADVEGAHGELRAGFADGLRGDHADRFAELHHAARSQVAAVAQGAHPAAGFAGEHGTDADALDARGLHGVRQLFGDLLVDLHDHVALEVLDLVEGHAAHD